MKQRTREMCMRRKWQKIGKRVRKESSKELDKGVFKKETKELRKCVQEWK